MSEPGAEVMAFEAVVSRLRAHPDFQSVDSALAAASVEALRAAFAARSDFFDRQWAFAQQIGLAIDERWRAVLIPVRDEFEDRSISWDIDQVNRACDSSLDAGWNTWLAAVATAVVRFRMRHAMGLCKPTYAFDSVRRSEAQSLRQAVACLRQSRWEESLDDVLWLAVRDALPERTRGRLFSIAGQIQFWRFEEKAAALQLLEQALRLAPDDATATMALGDCLAADGKDDEAEAAYRRAIGFEPCDSSGYAGLGDHCLKHERTEEAEHWFGEAMRKAAGDATGYERMLGLLGRPATLAANRERYAALMALRLAMDRDGEYDVLVTAGDHHRAATLHAEAEAYYAAAIASQPTWPRAYVQRGELGLARADERDAEAWGRRAIEVDPQCPEGYLLLSRMWEERQRWQEALEIFQRFPPKPRPWATYARASVGRMQAKLGLFEQAEQSLLQAFGADPASAHTQGALESFAVQAYEERKDDATALRLFDAMHRTLGKPFARSYHNLRGNYFYERGRHALAAAEFELAIAAAPDNAVYHRNLGNARWQLREFDAAHRAFEAAHAIDHDDKLLRDSLAGLANERGVASYARADYAAALVHFREAAATAPGKAVYHSNVARALESGATEGQRAAALAEAIASLEAALACGANADYDARLARLRRRSTFLERFGESAWAWGPLLTPIAVEVASDLIPLVEGPATGGLSEALAAEVQAMRSHLSERYGVAVPGLRFRGNEGDLAPGSVVVLLAEVPVLMATVRPDRHFVTTDEAAWAASGIAGESANEPLGRAPGRWVDPLDARKLAAQGHEVLEPVRFLMRTVEALLVRHLAEFVGHQEVAGLLATESAASDAAEPPPAPLISLLVGVCRGLLAEGVPIEPFAALADVVRACRAKGLGAAEIVEQVRALPAWRERLPSKEGGRARFEIGPRLATSLARAHYVDRGHGVLAMEPDACQEALAAVRERVTPRTAALVVATAALRPLVRSLVELEFPDLPVLAAGETERDALPVQPDPVEIDGDPQAPTERFGGLSRGAAPAGVDADDPFGSAGRVIVYMPMGLVTPRSQFDERRWDTLEKDVRQSLFQDLGVTAPTIELVFDGVLEGGRCRIVVEGVETVETGPNEEVGPRQMVVNEAPARLRLLNLAGRAIANPRGGEPYTVVDESDDTVERCRAAGFTLWGPQGFLALRLAAVLRRRAETLLTPELVQQGLDRLAESFPELVRIALERHPLQRLTAILRHLLDESVSIRDLHTILEVLLAIAGTTDVDDGRFIVFQAHADSLCLAPPGVEAAELGAAQLADHVRTGLKRQISHQYTRGASTLVVYLLAPALEQRVLRSAAEPLGEDECRRLRQAVDAELGSLPPSSQVPVMLTTLSVRRALRGLLVRSHPNLAVLCYQELSPELNIQPIARIDWS